MTTLVSSSASVTLNDSVQVSAVLQVPSPAEVILPILPVKLILGVESGSISSS